MRPPDSLPVAQDPGADLETTEDETAGGRWVVVNGGALVWVDQVTGRRWMLDPDDIGDMVWTAAPEATLSAAFVALVGLVRDARTAEARLAAAHDVIRRLRDGWEPDRYGHGSWWEKPGFRRDQVTAEHRAVLDAVAGPDGAEEADGGS